MKTFTRIIQTHSMTIIDGIVPGGGRVEGTGHHKSIDPRAKIKEPEKTCRR